MSDYYQNKYRIPSARLPHWDYGSNGAYFITICTKDREYDFGVIENETMHLSNIGILAELCWHQIPQHTPNVELGAYVVMPNHVHGIIIIDKPDDYVASKKTDEDVETRPINVETRYISSLPTPTAPLNPHKNQKMAAISPKPYSIPTIIGSYKASVTRHANRLGLNFGGWQPRFHDHIIRNEKSYAQIHEYIINNSANWEKDKFYNP